MSLNKRSYYVNVNKVTRKLKKKVDVSLKNDIDQWLGTSSQQTNCEQSEAPNNAVVAAADENIHCDEQLDNNDSGGTCCQMPLDQGSDSMCVPVLNASSLSIEIPAPQHCDQILMDEGSDYLWNLSFLEGPDMEGPELDVDPFEICVPGEGYADCVLTLRFDCEVCINCRCGVCNECFHTDGETCQHCNYCAAAIDSESESSSHHSVSDAEDDNESFDIDPSVEMSEQERVNEAITTEFREIVLDGDASQVLIKNLLTLFRKHNFGNFPKCPTTLLKTPTVTAVRSVPPGEYWHRGLNEDLVEYAKTSGCDSVKVSFSVDGIPVVKSSGADFYPICCCFNDSKEVYLAGVYYGVGKPKSSDVFMKDFVDEMNALIENGIQIKEKLVTIEMYMCVCDAVAKSWLLNIKGHNGYFSCTKCTVEGVTNRKRTAFLKADCPRRTDESFARQDQEEHHNGPTILNSLKTFRPVTNTVLDYMHLTLLGVQRKIVYMLLAGPKAVRQSGNVILRISNALEAMSAWIPCDFARKCRSLKYVKRFKATEWRLLLFYLGPVIFYKTLPKHIYEHMLVLNIAMTILSSPKFVRSHCHYAKELLTYFVKTFQVIYGKMFTSHNVHNLIHLADECLKHGPVDSFSAFRYENFYQKLKKMIRKGEKLLQQLSRRYGEQKLKKSAASTHDQCGTMYSGLHNNGPLPPWCMNPQYSSMKASGTKLNLLQANNCCTLLDESVVIIENFTTLKSTKEKVIIGRKFKNVTSLFNFPCESSVFGILYVCGLSSLKTWSVEKIKSKCFRMPHKKGFAIFPVLHSDFRSKVQGSCF